MKKFISIFLILVLCLSMSFVTISCSCSGDGKSGCKNCGRSPVYALGYCKSCYKSFMDYTYGD